MNKRKCVIRLILTLVVLAFAILPAGATPITFSGVHYYDAYAVTTKEVLPTEDCPATAELTFLDGQEILLTLTEGGPCGGRITPLEGKMTPSGQLELSFPDWLPVEDIVMGHVGCTFIAGVFPVYHGSFDGQSLLAETSFNCLIPEYWPPNDLFPTPVDGPVHWQWIIDLTISP